MKRVAALVLVCTLALGVAPPAARAAEEPGKPIDVVICLDISGSMDGLIESAKTKLWDIVNDLAKIKPTPQLRVALYTYGCDAYDPKTGWVTTEYFNSPELGGLKDGVGLVVDLGVVREVQQVRLALGRDPTTVALYAAPERTTPPDRLSGLTRLGSVTATGNEARINLAEPTETRFLVVWLTSLPEASADRFQGDVREEHRIEKGASS